MGFWSCICEFDEQRYSEVVVPAFLAGERDPLIASTHAVLNEYYRTHYFPPYNYEVSFAGLAEFMTGFDPTLRYRDLDRNYRAPAGWHRDDLSRLFEWTVTRETLHSFANLQTTGATLGQIWPDEHGAVGDLVRYQLEPHRSFWTPDGSGIAGWCSAQQAQELLTIMPSADGPYHPALLDRRRRFLAVLERSVANGHGLCWGRDLAICHRPEGVFADGRAWPEAM